MRGRPIYPSDKKRVAGFGPPCPVRPMVLPPEEVRSRFWVPVYYATNLGRKRGDKGGPGGGPRETTSCASGVSPGCPRTWSGSTMGEDRRLASRPDAERLARDRIARRPCFYAPPSYRLPWGSPLSVTVDARWRPWGLPYLGPSGRALAAGGGVSQKGARILEEQVPQTTPNPGNCAAAEAFHKVYFMRHNIVLWR